MTSFVPPIRRVKTAKGHYYRDGADHRIPGVTTILGNGVPKPALINWSANSTAEYAVDNWDRLTESTPSERLNTLKGARYSVSDKAKKRGTEVHGFGERLVKGEAINDVPDELRGHVEAYVRFLDQFDVDPILVEATVVSYKYGYAGTLDLIADLTTGEQGAIERWLLDLKTNEKGIFGETALQLAAYRYAEKYIADDGTERDMIPVVRTGAILISSEAAQLIPTTSGVEQLKAFWYAGQVGAFVDSSRDLIGAAIPPHNPDAPTMRVVFEESKA